MKHHILSWALSLLVVTVFASCRQAAVDHVGTASDSLITQAKLLTIERGEGYTLVTVLNPWDSNHGALQRYVLVPRDAEVPAQLPEGTLVRTPLKNALVYSSVHTSVMKELGMGASVGGVCDAQFFTDPDITQRVASGDLADCGSSMGPTIEKVIEMNPDGILLSPYQDASYGQITTLNIPIIECADYMETTPLGRAEWIKFYGALMGKDALADSIFNQVCARYDSICQQAAKLPHKPLVLTEMVISGVWNVPGGQSYMARLIQDAGGIHPWADDKSMGSLNLDFNQVLAVAQQADVWLIKSFYVHSLADVRGANALNEQFKAYATKRIYVCDTNATRLFEQFPFHPDRLLLDYYNIFSDVTGNQQANTVYYKRLLN